MMVVITVIFSKIYREFSRHVVIQLVQHHSFDVLPIRFLAGNVPRLTIF